MLSMQFILCKIFMTVGAYRSKNAMEHDMNSDSPTLAALCFRLQMEVEDSK